MNTIKRAVQNRIPKYIENGVRKSLLQNDHMNQFTEKSKDFDEALVLKLLNKLIDESNFYSWTTEYVLKALTVSAKEIRLNDFGLEQSTIDAVLVDFINYCGASAGVDYALYIIDIQKPSFLDLRFPG